MNKHTEEIVALEAKYGHRVQLQGKGPAKVLWAGLGNRSGLHGYAEELTDAKWAKSGARFMAKVKALPKGSKLELFVYQNVARDRGRWVFVREVKV